MRVSFHHVAVFTSMIGSLAASAATEPGASNTAARTIHREGIEWCDVWIPGANNRRLPAVLLVGDSICRGYYGVVEQALRGKASVARFATSACVADPAFMSQLDAVLKHFRFDVIHFNNGLHGAGYTEQEYESGLRAAVRRIRELQPAAKLILCTSTPRRNRHDLQRFAPINGRGTARNRIMKALARELGVPCDDLYPVVADHPEWYRPDGTHFTRDGYRALGQRVIAAVREALGE